VKAELFTISCFVTSFIQRRHFKLLSIYSHTTCKRSNGHSPRFLFTVGYLNLSTQQEYGLLYSIIYNFDSSGQASLNSRTCLRSKTSSLPAQRRYRQRMRPFPLVFKHHRTSRPSLRLLTPLIVIPCQG
jgi:hypothetical protein